MRLKLILQEFDYTIVHRKRKENGNSDGLSRMFSEAVSEGAIINALTGEAVEVDMKPGSESGNTERKHKGKDESETVRRDLSEKEKLEDLKEIHDSHIGGHAGIIRKYCKLKQFINWPGMKNGVENYIRVCEKCQKNKMTRHTRMPLMITDTPTTVFGKCSIDIIGPFSPSRSQYRYIFTIWDALSKFLIAVSLQDQTAKQVAKAFVDHVVLIHGIPQIILSDCGSQFLSETFKSVQIVRYQTQPLNKLSASIKMNINTKP